MENPQDAHAILRGGLSDLLLSVAVGDHVLDLGGDSATAVSINLLCRCERTLPRNSAARPPAPHPASGLKFHRRRSALNAAGSF
jgi:hypothetical protein